MAPRCEPEAASLVQLAERALAYAEKARAERTRSAYRSDWRAFEQWCRARDLISLPAAPSTLALYLTHLAELGRKASTIRRARIAVGQVHAEAGAARPDRDGRIRTLERGIGRVHGTREEGARPLLQHELARAVAVLGNSPRDERDRALLLVGFAGGFRAGELVGMRIENISYVDGSARILVARSKEDQLGRGEFTIIPPGSTRETCPVGALATWIGRVGRPCGPVFRMIGPGGVIEHRAMSERGVSRALQRALAHAGLDVHCSAHSLRAGLVTAAKAGGATDREVQVHCRMRSRRTLERYDHTELVPGRPNVAARLL